MRAFYCCLFLLILPLVGFGQGLKLTDVWALQKGDYNRDSLKNIKQQGRIYLKFQEVVTLQFQAENASTPPIIYQYRISETEKFNNWIEIGNQPIIQLPTLEDGNHVLEISTKNARNRVLYRLPMIVSETFWQEWWFRPLLGVYLVFLVGIGVYFFSLYNLRQQLKLQDVRNNIAADLHDEVGSNLNSIAIYVALLKKKSPKELLPILDKITFNSTESIQLMQDTIWAIQAKNDDFQKFIDRMRGFSTEILAAKGIALSFDNQVQSHKNLLTMETRKNAYLIYKEAINNIVKHAQASKVDVRIEVQREHILISVIDNGIGFDTQQTTDGNGLYNFVERAAHHEMHLAVESIIGQGTKILLEIPLR